MLNSRLEGSGCFELAISISSRECLRRWTSCRRLPKRILRNPGRRCSTMNIIEPSSSRASAKIRPMNDEQIKQAVTTGLVDGIATNPNKIAKWENLPKGFG